MPDFSRRDALKVLGAASIAATGGPLVNPPAAAADLKYTPEKGAELRVLRWKRFVQGDEEQWMANRAFTERTGVSVRGQRNFEDIRPKAAVAASVAVGRKLGW
jgi:multiple sugar transport system substrate-binding protein